MNVILPVSRTSDALQVAHTISAYNGDSDELMWETDVPRILDSLAIKIAETDEDDPGAVFSYSLTLKHVGTLSFLFRLPDAPAGAEFFLEPVTRYASSFSEKKVAAISELERLAARSINRNRLSRRITESELTVPALCVLADSDKKWVTTTALIERLTELFKPTGADAMILAGRSDTYFSQKVRNIISHKGHPTSFIHAGYADYLKQERGLRITSSGQTLISRLRA